MIVRVKVPKNLKIYIFSNKINFIIKLLNKKNVIKKKFDKQDIFFSFDEKNSFLILHLKTNNSVPMYKSIQAVKKLFIYKLVIENCILQIFKLHKSRLFLEGIGFKVWKKKNLLKFKLGFSAPYFLSIPKGIKISIYKQRKISILGISQQYVKQFVHKLQLLRLPDAYKQKGIRIWNKKIKLKIGKKTR